MNLYGVVARVRVNDPESGRPLMEPEYLRRSEQGELALTPVPLREWTPIRDEALSLPWDEAQELAREIGFPAHAVTVSGCMPESRHRCAAHVRVAPEVAFERLERRGLA